jgi:hypothetical protein
MNRPLRLQAIGNLINCKKYLEVGVENGSTFNAIFFQEKVAVDPLLKFDYKSIESESIKFHEYTSDDYFSSIYDGELFDLIFLDGLHTFDQTLRDFNNALMSSHKDSIIVIDDVYPCDVYSSLRRDAVKFRRLAEPESKNFAWHGDVYKTIFIIHDFYPQISFVTIDVGHGNPQTILYRKQRKKFTPFFKSIEEIERLSYFDFLKYRDLLNLRTEKEALDLVGEL